MNAICSTASRTCSDKLKVWPALDVDRLDDLLLAALDDFVPTAIEEHPPGGRIFFAIHEHRDTARAALSGRGIAASPVDVPDGDWAVRSQQNLTPITVGRLTVLPRPRPPAFARARIKRATARLAETPKARRRPAPRPQPLTIVIQPSMGFGTGHHATTRLCLAALQETNVIGASVLDVGTGSGILAIAAVRLGASQALGIDSDADAIQSAHENLALNPEARDVRFVVADLTTICREGGRLLFDVVMANLTGALLVRSASRLLHAVNSGGTLILSGILADEEETVRREFATDFAGPNKVRPAWHGQEDEWVCLGYSVGTD